MAHRDLMDYLLQFVSPHKRRLFDEKLLERTRHVTVVLENIRHAQNASAVLRSCDCFGIQDVHIIDDEELHRVTRGVALGAAQWLTLFRYREQANNTRHCLETLRGRGYRIVAATPSPDAVALDEYDITHPTALVFGAELTGLSETALNAVDGCLHIPMYGFTESLNISVAAAICLQHFASKLRNSEIDWQLTREEMREIKLAWTREAVKRWRDPLEKQFRRRTADDPPGDCQAEAP